MKKSILLLIALVLVCGAEAQVVQIQGGTAISKMDGKNEVARVGYSLFAESTIWIDRISTSLAMWE